MSDLIHCLTLPFAAKSLSRPVDVVIGTPGRALHFIEEGTLLLDNIQAFVLDEADQMLDTG